MHEAAHAVIAYMCKFKIMHVTMNDSGPGVGGHLELDPLEKELKKAELLFVLLAGALMEEEPIKWPPSLSAEGDEARAAWLVSELGLSEVDWIEATAKTARELMRCRPAVDALARALLERGELSGEDATAIIIEALSG
jgi:hypothetical protein